MSTPSTRTPVIGVFLPLEGNLVLPTITGLHRAADECGVRLILYGAQSYVLFRKFAECFALEQLAYDPELLDGTIIAYGAPPLLKRMQELHQGGHPCVL